MIRVMVVGAAGKMGSLTAATAGAQPDMQLVAEVDPAFAGGPAAAGRFATVDDALDAVTADVAVEFSTPASVAGNAASLLAAQVDTLVGATGLGDADLDRLRGVAAESGVRLFVVPNFSLGAVLMMRFAAEAARHLPRAEIVEIHEESKLDSPSGTSLRTAQLMEAAGAEARQSGDETRPSRGLGAGPVRIHSVRLPGVVAHQEVVFGGAAETLTIRHDSLARESFMPGVLLAIRGMERLQGTVVGLENLIT
jgi:4-hydroxy-tetrahydrodipicolinate reductase